MAGSDLELFDRGEGPLVLFVHGAGIDGGLWAEDLAWLAESGRRLVAYNRRGYGGSGESPGDWRAHGDDAVELLESLGPGVVCGHSGGALVALDVAARRPELVERLVLSDPLVHPRAFVTPGFVARLARIQVVRRLRGEEAAVADWIAYVSSHGDGSPSWWDRAPESRRRRVIANAAAIFADLGSSGAGHLGDERIRAIDRPVAILAAGLSPRFVRRSVARLERLLPAASVEPVPDAGHALAADDPEGFRAAFERVLAG
ncbi:MAG: alpha/beta hydrolase [Actinomycetota bacterium]|nr:alpha/beta hydrolase [Actinomycetota bacterium]